MQAENDVSRKKKRRWSFLWYFAALVLVIIAAITSIYVSAHNWRRHVETIDSLDATVSGKSNAPIWLQRLRSDDIDSDNVYWGEHPPQIGPDWLRSLLPTDELLILCQSVNRVEIEHETIVAVIMKNIPTQVHLDPSIKSKPNFYLDLLEHLQAFPELEELSLFTTKLDDNSLKGLRNLRHLRLLSLEATSISGEGLAYLTASNELEELKLDETNFCDDNVKYLENFYSTAAT